MLMSPLEKVHCSASFPIGGIILDQALRLLDVGSTKIARVRDSWKFCRLRPVVAVSDGCLSLLMQDNLSQARA